MTGELTFREILQISHVIPVLLVLSIICATAVFERLFCFLRYAGASGRVMDRIRQYLESGHVKEARAESIRGRGYIAKAITAQLEATHLPRTERESLVLLYHQKFQNILSKRLWIFGTLSFICPLIGLLGTVMGVMTAFGDLAISGSGGPTIVAAGISEALWATAAGIGLAIVAAVIFNCFNIWMKGSLSRADIFGQEMIILTVAAGGHTRAR